jgi:hypothetical protein
MTKSEQGRLVFVLKGRYFAWPVAGTGSSSPSGDRGADGVALYQIIAINAYRHSSRSLWLGLCPVDIEALETPNSRTER